MRENLKHLRILMNLIQLTELPVSAPGLSYYDQPSKSFNLSYRTRIGNDVEGTEHGYKIHILYNVIANPDIYSFETFKDSGVQPIEFGWTLTGTPPRS